MDASCNAKPAVVAVVGPTATGKTALGVALAQRFSGEVISADSMQIYRGLDVGTAKITPQETCGIPHHGVDILTPEKTFSVADFTALAGEYIQDITARGHLPLLVGGTGLYVQSLLYGVRFTAEKAPDGLREQLTAELDRQASQRTKGRFAAAGAPLPQPCAGAGFPGPCSAVPPHRPAGGQNAGGRAFGRGRIRLA